MQQKGKYKVLLGHSTPSSGWRSMWRVIVAEALKQRRNLLGNWPTYFSLLIWPGLQLATAYYTYRPFFDVQSFTEHWSLAATPQGIFLFVATGILGYVFFWSLVQSAWQFSFERFNGTLELLFLTPANRLVLVTANSVMALVQSVWLFFVFILGLVTLIGGLHVANPAMFIVAFLGLFFPAVAWGTFLNSIFIFIRNAEFLFTFLDEPLSFFAGVRIPLLALPMWAQVVGFIFPLTISLIVLRGILLTAATLATLWPQLLILLALSIVLLATAGWLLKIGEKHAQTRGSLTLF
jgi:ABC-2 type transport system permease protein